MNNSAFVRLTSPGLPTWPGLLFDANHKRAVVSFRMATWQSWLVAHKVSVWFSWTVNLLLGWWLWANLTFLENPIARGSITCFGFALVASLTKALFPIAFTGFLARQVFALRSTIWFTPEAIAFRSRLYTKGVVIWRRWRDRPVMARFDVAPDPEAMEGVNQYSAQYVEMSCRRHAQILRLIVTMPDLSRTAQPLQSNLMRAIPMCEIDGRDAARVAVVLTAAAALSAKHPAQPAQQHFGVDIDSAAPLPS